MHYFLNLNKYDVDSELQKLEGIPVTISGVTKVLKVDTLYLVMDQYVKLMKRNYTKRGMVLIPTEQVLDSSQSPVFIQNENEKEATKKEPLNLRFTKYKIGALQSYLGYIEKCEEAYRVRQSDRASNDKKFDEPVPLRLSKMKAKKKDIVGEINRLNKAIVEKKYPKFQFYKPSNTPWSGNINSYSVPDYTKKENMAGSGSVVTIE